MDGYQKRIITYPFFTVLEKLHAYVYTTDYSATSSVTSTLPLRTETFIISDSTSLDIFTLVSSL